MDIRFYAGIGDILTLESHWSPEFRASVRKIYLRPYQSVLLPLFAANRSTRHIKCYPVDYADYDERASEWHFQSRFHVIRRHNLPFYGSSFLTSRMAKISQFKLPSRYVVIQAQTTMNPSWNRDLRDMEEWEWSFVLKKLEENNIHAVVLNSDVADRPPKHPLVIDMIGQTSFAESLEILKSSSGYIGIDSWMSVMAAQLFSAENLLIRGVNAWLRQNLDIYYRPHKEFGFVVPTLGVFVKYL